METWGKALQVLGAAITVFGLLKTWWQWKPAEKNPVKRGWRKVSQRRKPVTVQASAVAVLTGVGAVTVATGRVTGGSLDARVTALQEELDRLAKQTQDRFALVANSLDRQEAALTEALKSVEERFTQYAAEVHAKTQDVALDGLGWAALGVVVSAIGSCLS